MRHLKELLSLAIGLLLVGCTTVPQPQEVVVVPPQETVARQADVAREAAGLVAQGSGSSLTMQMAQDKALRRARLALSQVIQARIDQLQVDFLEGAGSIDPPPVEAWLAGVAEYVRSLTLIGARPVMEKSQMDDGLATVWMLMVEDPGMIVQALEVRGAADRQLYELVRASVAYRALLAEAERFDVYRRALPHSQF